MHPLLNQELPLGALNHVSLVCSDVRTSLAFYRDVLGFSQIQRPSSFDFDGCWLYRYGIGLHLIKGRPVPRPAAINPSSDHLSFQSDEIDAVILMLKRMGIEFVTESVREGSIAVRQVFFHDPDHNMIEICNCESLPIVPIRSKSEMARGSSPSGSSTDSVL